MSYKTITAAVATIIALSTAGVYAAPAAPEAGDGAKGTSGIGQSVSLAIAKVSKSNPIFSEKFCGPEIPTEPEELHHCLFKFMEAPLTEVTKAQKAAVASNAGTICSYSPFCASSGPTSCGKTGAENCKLVCCALGVKNANIKNCCKDANPADTSIEKCCGSLAPKIPQ